MKLKQRPGDFRVHELLEEDYLEGSGPHHVYLVEKRKLTSIEAAQILADLANVRPADVSMAGLKDRQGVTTQYMSLPRGRRVELERPELRIRPVGSAKEALRSEHSRGNRFELRLRELEPREEERLEKNLAIVRKLGVPNYFGEQRFGNLRHGQGWVARELMLGEDERALRNLLCAESPHDSGRIGRFKASLRRAWGDWSDCRDIAGRFGEHHSVFEHLRREEGDFRGAFYHISSRLRLIHLYAYQSHVWNRALAWFLARVSGGKGARVADSIEGPLVFPERFLEEVAEWKGWLRLPGEGLEDVENPAQRALFEEVLSQDGIDAARFRIEGVSGFQLKGEERRMFVKAANLTARPERRAREGTWGLAFELPRGAYATMVVQALLAEKRRGPLDLSGRRQRRSSRRWQGENTAPPAGPRAGRGRGRRAARGRGASGGKRQRSRGPEAPVENVWTRRKKQQERRDPGPGE